MRRNQKRPRTLTGGFLRRTGAGLAKGGWDVRRVVLVLFAATALIAAAGCGPIQNEAVGENPGKMDMPEELDMSGKADVHKESEKLYHLPKITAPDELISPAGADFPMEYAETGDVFFLEDVDHDGEAERIELNLQEYEGQGGGGSFVEVRSDSSAESPVIWKRDYGTPHAGWAMVYLYRENGLDYLMEYAPAMYQGYGTYVLRLFSLDSQGTPQILREYGADFVLSMEKEDGYHSGFFGDEKAFLSFMKTAETYLNESLLLVSTDSGELAYSTPEYPITIRHDDRFWTGGWDVTGKMDSLECFDLVVQKNWKEAEGISLLTELRSKQIQTWANVKGEGRRYVTSDVVVSRLFEDLSGDNWVCLPDREVPSDNPDVLFHVLEQDSSDLYVSCYLNQELVVIWTSPYVWDLDNNLRITQEFYHLSSQAMEKLMVWEE